MTRTWLAAWACLLIVLTGSAMSLRAQSAADTPTNPFVNDPSAAAHGKATFETTCVVCHGAGGIGGRGPPLNGGSFNRGDQDYDLFKTIHDGIKGTGMPSFSGLPANDLWKVVSYIRSLDQGATGSSADAKSANGNAGRGAALFFGSGGCAACHEINGRGSAVAGDLSAAGKRGVAAIRAGLLHKPAMRGRARWIMAVMPHGGSVSGLVRAEDSFTILVERSDGSVARINRLTATITVDPAPDMAMARVAALPDADREDLTSFLAAQRARHLDGSIAQRAPQLLPAARLLASAKEPQNWLSYWGDYNGQHFSMLRTIERSNVRTLQARWAAQLPGDSALQSTPLVIDGVMYVSGSPGEVQALDAASGLLIWRFVRKQDVRNPYQINPSNRGVAVLDGRVFVTTLDDLVIALDARSGRQLWEKRIADTMEGYSLTGAPLALPGKIIVGMSGGEFGLRGFLDAYDPATGKRLWRFDTVPGPGQPGNETWGGDSWRRGGGATWLTGSYDPELNLLYWATGNPAPGFNPGKRPGDNLYTASVLALNPDRGTLRWHYQFTPADSHDWDAQAGLVLFDRKIASKPRKLLAQANRNGFHYVLDRTNGTFLHAEPTVRQTWNLGFGANGRPIINPKSIASPEGSSAFPAVGATNFQAPSLDPRTDTHYFVVSDTSVAVATEDQAFEPGRVYVAGRRMPSNPPAAAAQGIQAIDADGRTLWRFPLTRSSFSAGVLATAGDLLFAASGDGNLIALDSRTGEPLWRFQTGKPISASPMTFAVDGEQYIAISAGNIVYAFSLPRATRSPARSRVPDHSRK